MSAIAGILKTSDASTNELANEWQETVLVRNSKGFNTGSTLFGLMARLKKESADNLEFNWFERNPTKLDFYSSASALVGDATLSFDDNAATPDTSLWKMLNDGSVLRNNRTQEYVVVNGDPSSSSVAVLRGQFGTTAAAVNNDDLWTLVTSGRPEGSVAARAVYENPVTSTNYIQTFNETVYLSNAFKNSVLRTDLDGPLTERRIQSLERISNRIEMAYLFGKKSNAVSATSGTIYYTGGVVDALSQAGITSTNVLNGQTSTGVSLAAFQTWLQSFMVYGSDAKLAFCGPNAYAAISNYANSAAGGFRVMNQETVFGMNVTEILTPFGVLNLAFHPLLKNSTAHNGSMVVVDLGHIAQKTFEPLFLETNIQTPGQNAYVEQYRAQLGMKLKFPQAFGYAYDLQKITAS